MKSRREYRLGIINVLYKYELLDSKLSAGQIFSDESDIDNEQFKQLELISLNYDYYQKTILKFLSQSTTWSKLPPLIRAILLNATHELMSISPKIVINEAVEITKSFYEQEANFYKLVNALLQNIYKYFVINEAIENKEK
ncbi:Transcription termination factor NusB [Mycoplasmopsis agalactiae 14628]|uniref:Transcription termination factor NusB n=1 Tax=Mycoplasmopsis agalactiae 14628 TaxID=1110504 RepID=I5D6V6_MYCAA|nr:transcription antitermination protein NusB [Mycoplasmopsis agalactiae]EIN15415.1 Transcription termination factor NusB [Mycoplasmopsis agalactiae 14628]